MYLIDYHTHTYFSDGKQSHRDIIEQAIANGFNEIGISDHVSVKPVHWACEPSHYAELKNIFPGLKDKYAGKITVKFGLEVDYIQGFEDQTRNLIEFFAPDYVIGSVHFIDNWNFDTDASGYNSWELQNLYATYFGLVNKAAASGLFDIIGHLDLIKKFATEKPDNISVYVSDVIETIKKNKLCIELNTSGMRKPCKEFYPSFSILESCLLNNIPITLGSDAHFKIEQGQFFKEAVSLMEVLNCKQIISFTERKPKSIDINP